MYLWVCDLVPLPDACRGQQPSKAKPQIKNSFSSLSLLFLLNKMRQLQNLSSPSVFCSVSILLIWRTLNFTTPHPPPLSLSLSLSSPPSPSIHSPLFSSSLLSSPLWTQTTYLIDDNFDHFSILGAFLCCFRLQLLVHLPWAHHVLQKHRKYHFQQNRGKYHVQQKPGKYHVQQKYRGKPCSEKTYGNPLFCKNIGKYCVQQWADHRTSHAHTHTQIH